MRLQRNTKEFVKLLTNAREDGGLTKVQCEVMDRLVAQSEAILTGRSEDGPGSLQELLSHCGAPDAETLAKGWDCLREIAVEIGEITIMDLETFDPEDRTELQPRFGLQCRIRAVVGQLGSCCGRTGPRTAVTACEEGV
ncbi:MAG: hypothetical protein AB7E51_00375 [Pseudodesulfovibrio sp.]|uniref:hypothetical protein n=1 Tax=Pseudodesulfovibrio sp. TaxID=2035812 RepID=UPI003D130476